ncbi:hypothetical protein CPB83DRAFT_847160 [Crepidotus variabilis]|uniref:Uncharacterized protein n=1 Tax=Crepidotus variabilis TaxID=179855 RepID=A0A9P6JU73_9AGAR|nr:hypothetical protein CPB83DRAFT_847160 [Crepidotus variabilis]
MPINSGPVKFAIQLVLFLAMVHAYVLAPSRRASYDDSDFTTSSSSFGHTSKELADECIKIGFELGILGMVWKTNTFIKAVFLWMGRSSTPPFNKDDELGNKWWEYIKLLWSVLSALAAYGAGAAFLQEAYCPDELFRHMAGLKMWFEGFICLTAIILDIRRGIKVSRAKDGETAQRNSKIILGSNICLGLTGWLHWSAMARMLYWGTPYRLPAALSAVYWIIAAGIIGAIIYFDLMAKITAFESKIWNGILAVIFFGGFASAFFMELAGSIKYGTTFTVPKGSTGAFTWVQDIFTVISYWLTGS